MPLEAAFAAFATDDHTSALAIDDHACLHAASASTSWPIRRPGTLRAIPTALKHSDTEDADRSLMQITRVGPPEKARLDDLGQACKFDNFVSVFGDASQGATASRSAKDLGKAVAMSSGCVTNTSELVLTDIFGQKLKASGSGTGVAFDKTHDIPLGSLAKKELKSARASCEDFATFLLRRFEKPGSAPVCTVAGGAGAAAGGAKFTQKDATHALKSYGLCLDSIGETTALQGCEMGNLQRIGSAEAADLCKVVEGPMPPEIVCAIM